MAKVDVIELTVNGETHEYNINVGKAGLFKCHLHAVVAQEIGLEHNLFEASTLSELKKAIMIPYRNYLESKVIEEAVIWIAYESSGRYSDRQDGSAMFDTHSNDYRMRRFSVDPDGIAFEFGVVIKQTRSTGGISWYNARKGQGSMSYEEGDLCDPDTWYKNGYSQGLKGKSIPYSDEAYDVLLKAREGIRRVSETLFDFINQDEKMIETSLLQGNLLNSGNDEKM